MEMIYHRHAYLLILHHWDHMHNTNHKDFSRVVMGFRIKVGNIQELQLKSHRNQWSKNESTQTQIYKTCKTNHSIQQLPHLYISCINRPISWNFRRNYEHGQFVTLKTISSITSFLSFFFEFFHQNYINNGTHKLRMKTCSISPVIAVPQIQTPPHLFLAHPYIS